MLFCFQSGVPCRMIDSTKGNILINLYPPESSMRQLNAGPFLHPGWVHSDLPERSFNSLCWVRFAEGTNLPQAVRVFPGFGDSALVPQSLISWTVVRYSPISTSSTCEKSSWGISDDRALLWGWLSMLMNHWTILKLNGIQLDLQDWLLPGQE